MEKRTYRKIIIREKRNCQFCRLFQLHQKLHYEADNAEKEVITARIEKTKSRICKLNRILKSITQMPAHRDIAEIMGIPKGSVDSGLYYLKIYLEKK